MAGLENESQIIEEPTRTVAVVVGIETYQYSKPPHALQGVAFAGADAREIAVTLKSQFAISNDDMYLWINEDATKTRFENDLPYLAATMGPNDRFIFYYAGHGFYVNGANRLTAWDSHPTSLGNTTVCLREVLLSKLQKSECSQILLFIDACAVPLDEALKGRDVLGALSKREFEEFVNSREYHALFMSCSPGEKSFPSPILQHGIWTWHLLQALKGEAPEALHRGEWLTDASLRDYLRDKVEKFIREKTQITALQRPYASLQASHTFQILRFVEKASVPIAELPVPKLLPEKAFFRQRESRSFSKLPGFNKKLGHFSPDSVNPGADQFASRLLSEEIASESKKVYDNAKSVLGLKRSQIRRTVGEGAGSIDTDVFRMNWTSGQDPASPSLAVITRTLLLRGSLQEIPGNFDTIFPVCPDALVIPIGGSLDFNEIADGLEALEDVCGGTFQEDEDNGWASITLADGTTLTIFVNDSELVVTKSGERGILSLLRHSAQVLAQFGRSEAAVFLANRKQKRKLLPPGK
jgi:hypothetical protein